MIYYLLKHNQIDKIFPTQVQSHETEVLSNFLLSQLWNKDHLDYVSSCRGVLDCIKFPLFRRKFASMDSLLTVEIYNLISNLFDELN